MFFGEGKMSETRTPLGVKEIDGFALIHGQLHGPTGAPFHAFLILFQNAKGIDGMGFLGNLIIALQQLQGVKMTGHPFP